MPNAFPTKGNLAGLLFPGTLLLALSGLLAVQSGVVSLSASRQETTVFAPATVVVPARAFTYRLDGDYQRDGHAVDAPLVSVWHEPVEIMTYQVSALDYARCAAEGACEPAEPRRKGIGNVPVTGVSFADAEAYAVWLSARTGSHWRLPTVEEWNFVAGSKASDPALGIEGDNPADRWIAFYERQAELGKNALATPQPLGSYGVNEFGVADLAEAVWEWTASCDSRTTLDARGARASRLESCGVRLLEGRHRTAMSFFVRDAVAGGCSAGTPPDNLGFRLVRDANWLDSIASWLRL